MSPLSFMTDDEWFHEIENLQRRKRRMSEPELSCVAQACAGLRTLFQDIRDGFSLPKGATIKYMR